MFKWIRIWLLRHCESWKWVGPGVILSLGVAILPGLIVYFIKGLYRVNTVGLKLVHLDRHSQCRQDCAHRLIGEVHPVPKCPQVHDLTDGHPLDFGLGFYLDLIDGHPIQLTKFGWGSWCKNSECQMLQS